MKRIASNSFAKEVRVVAIAATLVSLAAFLCFYSRGEVLLYGDAVAHINIARRVFDGRTPGLQQLGSVWLPLPHVVTIPFVVNDWMWRTGVGGAIPAMIAYVFGVAGIFRVLRRRASLVAAGSGAAVYALNPNLLYMQSTGMTESIFLATVIWTVVYLDDFVTAMRAGVDAGGAGLQRLEPHAALERLGMVLAASILTRYDGWVLAGISGVIVFGVLLQRWKQREREQRRRLFRSAVDFYLLCALVPTLWLAQNYSNTGNPLDFANGPYSAKAIAERSTPPGQPANPGSGSIKIAAIYFQKAAKLNVAWGAWEPWMLGLLLGGTVVALLHWRRDAILLLLWFVLPFYAYSVAYGSVPIFLPVWWPFSYYNVRYGLELLPAFSVFIGLLIGFLDSRFQRVLVQRTVVVTAVVLVGGSYLAVARATPICLREARVNSVTRVALETRLGQELRKLPPDSTLLMYTSNYVGALQREGIPLRRVIWEGVNPEWYFALAMPAMHADYVVAVEGDPVSKAVHEYPVGLEPIVQFDSVDKPRVTIYRSLERKRHSGSPEVHIGHEMRTRQGARIQQNPV